MQNLYALQVPGSAKPDDKCWKARGQHSAADGSGQHLLDYEFYFTGSFMSSVQHHAHRPRQRTLMALLSIRQHHDLQAAAAGYQISTI